MSPSGSATTAYVAVRDQLRRAAIAGDLRDHGWHVVEHATTLHLLAELADCILGLRPAQPAVGLIVTEDPAPGCRGMTIAEGLRDLGVDIPVVVVAGAAAQPVDFERRA